MKKYKETCEDIDEKKVAWKVLKVIGMVLLGIIAGAFFGFIIMWLWNWLMPMIFGLTTLTYWQAVGLFILAKIIFGGIGGGSDSSSKKKKKKGTIRYTIKKEIKDEIKKEFDKEFDKDQEKARAKKAAKSGETANDSDDSKDYDEMYEAWWAKEGEKSFEKFMSDDEKE